MPIPKPPLPNVPTGLSLAPLIPQPPIPDLNGAIPCCVLPPITIPPIPNPLGALVLTSPVLQALRAAVLAAENYFDSIPLDCPRA